MKPKIITGLLSFTVLMASGQDKILSVGYTKNFVDKDSSNFSISIDLNRAPGKTEGAGTYTLFTAPLGPLDFYIKPTADINIGTYTTSAPNNISVGLPIGLGYEFRNVDYGYFALWGEVSSDMVSDKSFNQYLYYFSPGIVFNYTFNDTSQRVLLDFGIGAYASFGKRIQDVKTKAKNDYRKFYVPISVSLSTFKNKAKDYYRVKFTGIYKYNHIREDDPVITTVKDKNYVVLKIDFYLFKKLAINLAYNAGYEEPLFKKVNSMSFGFTFSR